MKICHVFLLCSLVAVVPSSSLGAGKLHTFTTPDGRSLNAKIKSYNDRTRKIQIEREDGKELWTLPTVFSEPDQKYIQQWIAADQFMSPTKFRIKGHSNKDKSSKNTMTMEHKTKIIYEITLENKTDFPLRNLKIEYRTFILSQGYEEYKDSNRAGGGQLNIAEIPTGKKVTKKAQPIVLVTSFRSVSESDFYGNVTTYQKKTKKEQLKGFWIKVYGPEIDGVPTIREWCNPSDTPEDFAWGEPQIRDRHNYRSEEHSLLVKARKLWKSDPEKALEIAHQCYEIDQSPKAACTIGRTYLYYLNPYNAPLGIEWLEKAAAGNDYNACCWLTKTYSTYIDPQYHNSKKGIKYGLQTVSLDPKNARGHDKLAEAYALDGQFEKAVEHATIAYDIYKLHGPEGFVPIMKDRLKLYRNHQPCPLY